MTTYNTTNNGFTNHVTKEHNTKHIITSTTKLNNKNMNHLVLEVQKDIRGDVDLKELYLDLWVSKLEHENKINLFVGEQRVWMKHLKPEFKGERQSQIESNTDVLNVWEGKVRDFKVKIEILEIEETEFKSRITIEELTHGKNNK